MTEKNMSGKINELLETLKDDEKRQAFLNDFEEFLTNYHQPAFAVGEYYSFTTYRKDYDADTTFIFKVLRIKGSGIRVIEYDIHGEELSEYVYDIDSDFLKKSTPATAEQIATFKRAEHFASKGRKLDEFHVGDKVSIVGTDEIVKIDSLRGDSSFGGVSDLGNYFIISTPSYYGVTLIQTAEELQEKPHLQAAAPPGYVRQPRKE